MADAQAETIARNCEPVIDGDSATARVLPHRDLSAAMPNISGELSLLIDRSPRLYEATPW